jgi:polyhydroxyalkanoate synthase
MDGTQQGAMGFALRQVVDAMSPGNCLATNPEALQTALDSGGASLVEGARLFMADLARGRISMSDDQAFEVGRNLATTPGSVVFENELMQLIQYAPTTPKVHKRPLVIVPPCINKFYILDLQPENSLVAYAVAQGHTVFLVSWRNVGTAQGGLAGTTTSSRVCCRPCRWPARSAARTASTPSASASAAPCWPARWQWQRARRSAGGQRHAADDDAGLRDTGELGLMVDEATVAKREASIGSGGCCAAENWHRSSRRCVPTT